MRTGFSARRAPRSPHLDDRRRLSGTPCAHPAWTRLWLGIALSWAACWCWSCGPGPARGAGAVSPDGGPADYGRAWPAADALFRSDPTFRGGDGAHSVALDGERTLFLFGDSFIAAPGAPQRRGARMVRNSIALMEGTDPAQAQIAFHHGADPDGGPDAYFPSRADGAWYWPADGVWLDGQLSVLLHRLVATPGQGLGFAIDGFELWRTAASPSTRPRAWRWERVPVPGDAPQQFLAVTLLQDGEHVYIYGTREPDHDVLLGRYPRADFRAGALQAPQYWGGPDLGFGAQRPATLFAPGATEFSVGPDPGGTGVVVVYSRGFGATTIAMRRAPALSGPFSAPMDLYTPPESHGPQPFVYAAKAHHQLRGAPLVATYATNSFDWDALLDDEGLYYPRFVRLYPPGRREP